MTSRGSDLPGVTTAHMLEELVRGYEAVCKAKAAGKADVNERPAKPVRLLL